MATERKFDIAEIPPPEGPEIHNEPDHEISESGRRDNTVIITHDLLRKVITIFDLTHRSHVYIGDGHVHTLHNLIAVTECEPHPFNVGLHKALSPAKNFVGGGTLSWTHSRNGEEETDPHNEFADNAEHAETNVFPATVALDAHATGTEGAVDTLVDHVATDDTITVCALNVAFGAAWADSASDAVA